MRRLPGTARPVAALALVALLISLGACGRADDPAPTAAVTTVTTAPPTTAEGADTSSTPKAKGSAEKLPPGPAKTFCTYAEGVDLTKLPNLDWKVGFGKIYDAITNAVPVAPPELKQAVADLKAGLDQLKPLVDAGQVGSGDQFHNWFVSQDAGLQQRMVLALRQIDLYGSANC
jgi:hypothetical protein